MTSVLNRITGLFIDKEFLKHASIMFIATLIGSICNYIFQVYIGRSLGPVEYGIFGSLFAIFYILSILAATIQTGVSRFISKFTGENNQNQTTYFLKEMIKQMFILGCIIFIIIVVLSNSISSFLKIDSVLPILILGSVFLFSTILPVCSGTLQGLQKFSSLGSINIINFGSKLIFGIALVIFGYGVNGAIGAIVIGTGFAVFFSFVYLKKFLKKDTVYHKQFDFNELYRYSFPTLIAMFCFTVPSNIDLIIAKHFFDAHTAGLYTAATVLGKIILFIPGAIAIVMFPKISKLHTENKETVTLLLKSLFYTGLLSGFITFIYWFFPSQIVGIPYGNEYISIVPILQIYALVMLLFSFTIVIMRYCLAIHDVKYVYVLSFFTGLEIISLILFSNSILKMVQILLIGNCLLLFFSLLYIIKRTALKKRTLKVIQNG